MASLTTVGTFATADGGSVTIDSTGAFTYDPTDVAAFETLPAGQTTTDSFSFTVTDSHGQTSTATETITIAGDLATAPTNLSITPIGPSAGGTFALGQSGTLEVKASFDGNNTAETHTIDIQLQPGFTATDLTAGTHTGWTENGITYNLTYTYTPTNGTIMGDILVQIPDSQAFLDSSHNPNDSSSNVDLIFDITAPSTGTLPSVLTFNETATAYPTGDTVDGTIPVSLGGDEQVATATTGIPSAHLLTGSFVTNTNVQVQEAVLSFIDESNPLDSFSQLLTFHGTGQASTFAGDAGFNIQAAHTFEVVLESALTSTSQIDVTNFVLNGVTIDGAPHTTSKINYTLSGSTTEALTSEIIPDGSHTTSTYLDSQDGTSISNTLTGTSTNGNYVYGFDGSDILHGGTGNTFLNGGAGADSVTGSSGNDVIIYDHADTIESGGVGGFDTLRIDQGAIYDTSLEVSGASSGGFANSIVNLITGPTLSHFQEVLITEEAIASNTLGTELVLNAATIASMSPANASDGGAHDLYIVGSHGDNVQLADFGSWTNTHTTVQPVTGGATFTEWTAVSGGTTVHLFVDNVLGNPTIAGGAAVHA